MNSSPDLRKDIVLIVADIVLAVVVVLFLDYFDVKLTTAEDIMIGLLLTMSFLLIEIFWLVSRMEEQEREEWRARLIEHRFEKILHNIRAHYSDMAQMFYGDSDLFKDYFDRRLAETEEFIKSAAVHRELYVEDYHFHNTDLVLDVFRGDSSGLLRYVWILNPKEDLFDENWKHYCRQIEEATKQAEIKEVRALLVLTPLLTRDHPAIKKLAGYFEFTKGFSYRLIEENKYLHQKNDSRIGSEYIDFGIYGQRYIFLTMSYGEVIAGKFCKDADVIGRYTRFFDIVWSCNSASILPKDSLSQARLTDLFDLTLS
jgi:hypothetical protein